jgi:serine/threonine protein kinase/Tol biopolymer transport system component
MTPNRWQQVDKLLEQALEQEPDRRAAFLDEACNGDAALRQEVESLLSAHGRAGDFIAAPALGVAAPTSRGAGVRVLAGQQLGPYHIESMLGEGGMGVVYRARDPKLNRFVAVKVLSEDVADYAARRRFQREAQLASSLNHPHILTVYDAGEFEGRQYLVTEFVDGGTLKDWAGAERRSWRQVVELLVGVADGLAAAHAAGVLHRDVKPSNVLVTKSRYAKLADFGLAKFEVRRVPEATDQTPTQSATQTGLILGTLAYMSPEQVVGRPIDSRSDIFSFGVLLYELLAGHRPFEAKTDLELLQSIVHGSAKSLGDQVPLLLRIAVEKALEKDPAERYQTMHDFVVDLKRVLRIRTATEPSAVLTRPRNHSWLATIVALLALIAGALFWLLLRAPATLENPLANAHFTRLTDFPGFEEDAAISPDGKFVVFVSDRDGPYDIWLSQVATGQFFNLTKGKEKDSGVMVRKIGFSSDGSHIWLAGGGGEKLRLMPLMGGQFRPFVRNMVNVAWSADGGRMVYHTDDPGDPMFVADQTGANRRQILEAEPGVHHHYPAWSPDGQWIYFASGNFNANEMDLWRIPSAGGAAERLTQINSDLRYVVPLNERTMLYISPDKDGSGPWLWAFNVGRKVAHRVSFGLERYTSLSASSDGRSLVASVSNPSASLFTVPLLDRVVEERDVRPYPVPTVRALAPRFAGLSLFYLSSRGTGDGLWRSRKGEVLEIWRGAAGRLLEPPAPSPDGQSVGVVLRREGKLRLGLLSADGAELQILADSIEVKGTAGWSPDSKWIVTAGSDGTGPGLFKIPSAGGPPVRLTKGEATNPVWSPDGRLIVYTGTNVGILAPLRATLPDGTPVDLPKIEVRNGGERYRFLPDGKSLIYMQGDIGPQDFWTLDLATRRTRRLTHLNNRAAMRTFDITPDGKEIVFDRLRENSDVVLIDLSGRP